MDGGRWVDEMICWNKTTTTASGAGGTALPGPELLTNDNDMSSQAYARRTNGRSISCPFHFHDANAIGGRPVHWYTTELGVKRFLAAELLIDRHGSLCKSARRRSESPDAVVK